ncbi:TPA: 50S ribosomal protein L14e [Candidatus Micrarchaeota archaeon]|nr:50S ribosomal protein L14e [Candidatus Micrarchaeota archaeon]
MPAIQVGRKCVKTKGRKSGKTVVVTKLIDSNFVEVKDDKGKTKRCNVQHLEPV